MGRTSRRPHLPAPLCTSPVVKADRQTGRGNTALPCPRYPCAGTCITGSDRSANLRPFRDLLSFLDLNSSPNPFQDATTVFAMINYTGQWNGGLFTYGTNVLIDGEEFSVGGQEWKIDYDYAYNPASPTTTRPLNYQGDYLPSSGTQRFVAVTAIPEPSAFALAAIGAGLAAWAARRHRRGRAC